MDKRKLRKIPREAPTEFIKAAAENLGEGSYIATAHRVDSSNILQLYIYEQVEGKTIERCRTYLNDSDYITQDLTSAKPKWLTGKLYNILDLWWWSSRPTKIEFLDPESLATFNEFFPENADHQRWIYRLYKWQEKICAKRLQEKHRKILAISEQIAAIGDQPLPKNFESWIRETVHHDSFYLIYQPSRKRHNTAYCTHCKSYVDIDQKEMKPRRGKKGTCPRCRTEVTFTTPFYNIPVSEQAAMIAQKCEGGIVFRYFVSWLSYQKSAEVLKPTEKISRTELCRDFWFEDGRREIVEWGKYKSDDYLTWCPEGVASQYWPNIDIGYAHVYTYGLRETLKDTPWKYSGLPEYQDKVGSRAISVSNYICRYREHPFLEYLSKSGMTSMLDDLLHSRYYGYFNTLCVPINEEGKTPTEIFGISKPYLRMLIQMNGNTGTLRLLKRCQRDGAIPKQDELKRFEELFSDDADLLGKIDRYRINIAKYINYLTKQARKHEVPKATRTHWDHPRAGESKKFDLRHFIRNLSRDWNDYTTWLELLHYDLTDEYYLLPPDLRKAHDRVLNIILERKEAERKAMNELCQTVLSEMNESPIRKMHTKSLIVRIPRNAQDLKDEGIHNHNCVGTYVDKVARRETLILFIRKAEDPDTTYYTMEYCNGQLVQCRGMHNETAKGEVMAFAKAITRKLNDISNEQQKKKCGINTDMSRLKAAI